MKKYTIKDKSGTKKTIFAKDLSHALTFVDSSLNDFEPFFFKEDETFKADADYIGERLKVENFIDEYNDYEDFVDTEFTAKVLGGFGNQRENNEMRRYFEEKWPQKAKLAHKLFDSMNSKVKDDALEGEYHTEYGDKLIVSKVNASTYSYFDVDTKHTIRVSINALKADIKAKRLIKDSTKDDSINDSIKDDYLGMVKINGRIWYVIHKKSVGMPEFWGITPDKWGDNPKKKFKSKAELDKYLKSVGATTDSKTKDEANLPTTLQALVNDEEAAIKAYEVAIKNLEGKIDEDAKQVLINIMKDERRHVENLYAILNGQVTEKNLEDSIHDASIERQIRG